MTTILLISLALIGLWLFGGIGLRLLGIIAIAAGLLQPLAGQQPGALLLVPVGLALWLAGHWHYALRHDHFKSPMAERIFTRRRPTGVDPNWTTQACPTSLRPDELDRASARQRSAIRPT